MKFTINRPAFINQLNNVLRAISSKTTIPILTGLKMVVTDHSVILTGSDADITIESTLDASDSSYGLSIEEPGAIVLPARFFNEVIKKLPDKQATIEVFNGLQVRIPQGRLNLRSTVRMPTIIHTCQKSKVKIRLNWLLTCCVKLLTRHGLPFLNKKVGQF